MKMSDNTNNFIDANKVAILQELRGGISSLQQLISETLPHTLKENEEPVPPNISEIYIDMGLSMGYIVGLFNELQTLEFGVDDDDEKRQVGFAAMINNQENIGRK